MACDAAAKRDARTTRPRTVRPRPQTTTHSWPTCTNKPRSVARGVDQREQGDVSPDLVRSTGTAKTWSIGSIGTIRRRRRPPPAAPRLNTLCRPSSLSTRTFSPRPCSSWHDPDGIIVYTSRPIAAGDKLLATYDLCSDYGDHEADDDDGTKEIFRDFGFVEPYPQRRTWPPSVCGSRYTKTNVTSHYYRSGGTIMYDGGRLRRLDNDDPTDHPESIPTTHPLPMGVGMGTHAGLCHTPFVDHASAVDWANPSIISWPRTTNNRPQRRCCQLLNILPASRYDA
jgi:hypothetical protein